VFRKFSSALSTQALTGTLTIPTSLSYFHTNNSRYFIHVVDARLVKQHGLRKYKPLIGYYTRLGILSICMDVMLLGLMALPNQVVYIQFHPVAYVSLALVLCCLV